VAAVPNFNSIWTYSPFHPIGILTCACILACSVWLCAIARSWLGWTIYGALTALMIFPVSFVFLKYFVIDPSLKDRGGIVGAGVFMMVTGPLALAWLLGLPVGLLFRLGRAEQKS
jgi:hypothetical protein